MNMQTTGLPQAAGTTDRRAVLWMDNSKLHAERYSEQIRFTEEESIKLNTIKEAEHQECCSYAAP